MISISILYLRYIVSDPIKAYGFGDGKGSLKLMTKLFMEDEFKKAPTYSLYIENLFGIEDSIITKFWEQVFRKNIRWSGDKV